MKLQGFGVGRILRDRVRRHADQFAVKNPSYTKSLKHRVPLQRENGKQMEFDVIAESSCGRVVIVEVKKTQEPIGKQAVEDFLEKLELYAPKIPDKIIMPAFLSLGGFTADAQRLCQEHGIATAERIAHF